MCKRVPISTTPIDEEIDDRDVITCNHESKLSSDLGQLKIQTITQPSTKVTDLKISVPSFCKAFPWHFLTDKNLQIVQLGSGFMKLFGRQLNQLGEFYFPSYISYVSYFVRICKCKIIQLPVIYRTDF